MGCNASTFTTLPNGQAGGANCKCQCHRNGAPMENGLKPKGANSVPNFDNLKEDPRIPLSGRQIFNLKRSWKGISRNIVETGVNMFLSLFEKNEDVIKFFKGIDKSMTLAELRTCKVLENHARGVMLTIDEAITTMDEADTVIDMLTHVGRTHVRFEGFDPNVFWLLQEPFLLAVKDTLGDRYSAHMQDIYQRAISFILRTLIGGFNLQKQMDGEQPLAITDLANA